MNIQALREMIRVLRHVGNNEQMAKSFNLASWYSGNCKQLAESGATSAPSCGTTACACGFAAFDPWFIKQRFVLKNGVPTFGGYGGWTAVQCFFDLDINQVAKLFSPTCYPFNATPLVVVNRIEQLLKGTHEPI